MVPEGDGRITLYIADYYNGRVRAVTPDGIIGTSGAMVASAFGAPTRAAFAPKRASLWVADSSLDRLVALRIRPTAPAARPDPSAPAPAGASKRVGG